MRILRVLTRANVGGPARQANALYREHAALGHQTLLVTGVCERGEPELALDVPPAASAGAPGRYTIDALRRAPSLRHDRAARRELAALIDAFRPDVVHTHMSKAGWLGRSVARARGVPVVAHTYTGLVLRDYYGPLRSWVLARAERIAARRADLNFAVSDSCRDELAELGVTPNAIVVPPAVDVAPFDRAAARRRLGLDDDVCVAGFVGRGSPIKQLPSFLATVDACPEVRGILVTPADPGIRHDRLTVQVGGDGRELIAAFDVLVLPSRREGFPLVVAEAAHAGVPTVGFDVPGVRDAITLAGGAPTQLVPPDRGATGLASAVRRVIEGCPAPSREIVEHCDPRRVASCLIEHYGSMLGDR